MNFRTTAILVIVVAFLAALALLLSRQPTQPPRPEDAQKLLKLAAADVQRIVIAPATGQRMVLERTDDGWRLVEPITATAAKWTVDSLAQALVGIRSRGQVNESGAVTGLSPPRFVVELHPKAGDAVTLHVGNRLGAGGGLYLQLAGQRQTHVVEASLYEQLSKPWNQFREQRLVSTLPSDIRQIDIVRESGRLTMHREGDDWQITEPQKMPGESTEISSITSAIAYLTAREFVSEDELTPLGDPRGNPRITVSFSTQPPATQPAATQPAMTTIRFGGYDGPLKENIFVALSDPPTLAKVSASSIDAFEKKPLDLRDRRIVNIDPSQVSRIAITTEIPAATQPTTRPASRQELVIARKKETIEAASRPPATQPAAPAETALATAPAADAATRPVVGATTDTTQPATAAATTTAATQPAPPPLPPTVWQLLSADGADASQSRVEALLNRFHPLRVDRYLAEPPTIDQPAAIYTVVINTEAAGGARSARYELRLIDPGNARPLSGEHDGLYFETGRSLLDSMTGDFANKVEPVPAEPRTPGLDLGGGMPMDFGP